MGRHRMHDRQAAVVTAALVALIGLACSRQGGDRPLEPGPPPPHVMAVISAPSLEHTIGGAGALLDVIAAGEGSVMALAAPQTLAGWVSAASIDGADLAAPMYLVVLEPPAGPRQAVLIARVADRDRLVLSVRSAGLRIFQGWAAIGVRSAVEAVAPWGLTALVSRRPPAALTIELTPDVVLAAHGGVLRPPPDAWSGIDSGSADAMGTFYQHLGHALFAAFEQSSRVVITAEASLGGLELELALTPVPATALANFVAAQRPSAFPLLDRSHTTGASWFAMGRIALGPLRRHAVTVLTPWLTQPFGGSASATDLAGLVQLSGSLGGELAVIGGVEGDRWHVTALLGVDDVAAAAAHGAAVAAAMRTRPMTHVVTMGIPADVQTQPQVDIQGIPFTSWRARYELDRLPPQARAVGEQLDGIEWLYGAWDDVVALVVASDARAVAASLIDRSRNPPPLRALPPGAALLVDDAQARGDFFVQVVDPVVVPDSAPSLAAQWVSLGASRGILTVRLACSPATVDQLGRRFGAPSP